MSYVPPRTWRWHATMEGSVKKLRDNYVIYKAYGRGKQALPWYALVRGSQFGFETRPAQRHRIIAESADPDELRRIWRLL